MHVLYLLVSSQTDTTQPAPDPCQLPPPRPHPVPTGKGPSSKTKKAQQFGIPVLDEAGLWELVEQRCAAAEQAAAEQAAEQTAAPGQAAAGQAAAESTVAAAQAVTEAGAGDAVAAKAEPAGKGRRKAAGGAAAATPPAEGAAVTPAGGKVAASRDVAGVAKKWVEGVGEANAKVLMRIAADVPALLALSEVRQLRQGLVGVPPHRRALSRLVCLSQMVWCIAGLSGQRHDAFMPPHAPPPVLLGLTPSPSAAITLSLCFRNTHPVLP